MIKDDAANGLYVKTEQSVFKDFKIKCSRFYYVALIFRFSLHDHCH